AGRAVPSPPRDGGGRRRVQLRARETARRRRARPSARRHAVRRGPRPGCREGGSVGAECGLPLRTPRHPPRRRRASRPGPAERHGSMKAVMVGTGPFRIKKYEPGFYAELERNPSYWGKNLPRVDGIVFVVTRDESARVADLRRGALDIASVRDARLADGAMADKSLRVASPPPAQVIAMAFNQERPPFATR